MNELIQQFRNIVGTPPAGLEFVEYFISIAFVIFVIVAVLKVFTYVFKF